MRDAFGKPGYTMTTRAESDLLRCDKVRGVTSYLLYQVVTYPS